MYLNRAIVIGNLTRDPELKSLPSGIQVCTFSVATNRVWKDKAGVRQESADYHNIVVFGRQAETAAQYLRKGSGVLVEGRMQTRSWDGPDGKKNYRTEIVADRVQFGNRAQGGAANASTAPTPSGNASEGKQQEVPPMETIEYPAEEINLDDIPF
ncbi:MAG: single-strand binding protein single-strand DNA-binding protein [Parcubacteria group bacterium]|nr:single-strand binding protein single-strand DNA-binding protein [Parcubacteria group bacterium]